MKLLTHMKDGGAESKVHGYFLIEWKKLFSVVLLRFDNGSREAYHEHAFDAVSWLLWGRLVEDMLGGRVNWYWPSLLPIVTKRDTFHKVSSFGTTWALSFRGPWSKTWREWLPKEQRFVTLTNGRKEVRL